MAKPKVPSTRIERQVELTAQIPDTVITRYASIVAAQPLDNNLLLSFFEPHPPIFFGTPEAQTAQLANIKSVPAECVARIIVSPERVEELIKLLTAALEPFREPQAQKE